MAAEDEPRIASKFVKLSNAEASGRCADFTLVNETDYTVMCVRGMIVGYDRENKKVYEFPWSHGRMPELIKPNSEILLEGVGFNMPDEVSKVDYILEEFDLVK
ncbi:MAG: hypothetical protein ACQKBY_07290 [Verrucomicrobiales bacterium]